MIAHFKSFGNDLILKQVTFLLAIYRPVVSINLSFLKILNAVNTRDIDFLMRGVDSLLANNRQCH
jgi:hypothetical protein